MTQTAASPTSRVYFSQRLRLHYVDWGNPGKPPLLLVHGLLGYSFSWRFSIGLSLSSLISCSH